MAPLHPGPGEACVCHMCTRPRAPPRARPSGVHSPASPPRRNILRLINAFDLPEQSISRDDYTAALARLNASQPARVARLPLEACRLEDFLDKVRRGRGGAAGGCRR